MATEPSPLQAFGKVPKRLRRVAEIDGILRLTEAEADAMERCLRVHDALVTLADDADPDLFRRPPTEHFDFLGESCSPPVADLFGGLSP